MASGSMIGTTPMAEYRKFYGQTLFVDDGFFLLLDTELKDLRISRPHEAFRGDRQKWKSHASQTKLSSSIRSTNDSYINPHTRSLV